VMRGEERVRYGAAYEREYQDQLARNNAELIGDVFKRVHPMKWIHDTWDERKWEEKEAKRKARNKKKEFAE